MRRSHHRAAVLALYLTLAACGSTTAPPDSGGGDSAAAADTAPANDGATGAPDVTSDAPSGSSCRRVGEACAAGNYCSAWICRCQNTSIDFMTVGDCENGMCSATPSSCMRICNNAGGVRETVDQGCM